MILDVIVVPVNTVHVVDVSTKRAGGGQEAEVPADRRGGPGEELRELVLVEVDEDAGEREREQVVTQEAVAVDGVAPGPAHAAGCCEPARPDAAEDVRKQVVRQARRAWSASR